MAAHDRRQRGAQPPRPGAGDSGDFLSGAPHGVGFATEAGPVVEQQRLAGNTLPLERGDLLVRVEGRIGRGRAIAIARSVPRGP